MINAAFALALAVAAAPATQRHPVTDTYFGTTVVDDFRWLEFWDDPGVKLWSDAQSAFARKQLDKLPGRAAIEKRVGELMSFESPAWFGLVQKKSALFAMKSQPPKQQPFLVVMNVDGDPRSERTLLEPKDASIDWFVPSFDGSLVAVSLSSGGTESGDVHVLETATGKERDVVPRANSGTAGGGLAWKKDGSGFWYTRHPAPGERADEDLGFWQQVWFHKLGTDAAKDTKSLGDELPRTAESFFDVSDDGKWIADLVQLGDGGEFELYVLDVAKNAWTKRAVYADRIVDASFGGDGGLWCVSKKDAPRGKIVRMDPKTGAFTQVTGEGEAVIDALVPAKTKLYVAEQLGGPSRLRTLDLKGKELSTLSTPPVSAVVDVAVKPGTDDAWFLVQSFTQPLTWFTATKAGVQKTSLAQQPPVSFDDVVVSRIEAVSKDGTRIPISIVEMKGTPRDGKNPTLLTGYGGFSIPSTPRFSKPLHAFLEQGGVYALANLRGGSEYGEEWHKQGSKTMKQNVFDDFIAAAEALIAQNVTNPSKLAIQGGSNGGLLMGAALTQRPDLFRAVVAQVGYFDMLRYETKPNGAFNNTEYGSVQNEDEFKALYAYSPYHHVVEGAKYPPVLFMTGANDPRVDPLHSRKMVARLQQVGADAWLRTSSGTGHGGGTPLAARIAEQVDIYAFLYARLGILPGGRPSTNPVAR